MVIGQWWKAFQRDYIFYFETAIQKCDKDQTLQLYGSLTAKLQAFIDDLAHWILRVNRSEDLISWRGF